MKVREKLDEANELNYPDIIKLQKRVKEIKDHEEEARKNKSLRTILESPFRNYIFTANGDKIGSQGHEEKNVRFTTEDSKEETFSRISQECSTSRLNTHLGGLKFLATVRADILSFIGESGIRDDKTTKSRSIEEDDGSDNTHEEDDSSDDASQNSRSL
ncbi:hypothetical protein Tco_0491649 [Tanacetum coccineum]